MYNIDLSKTVSKPKFYLCKPDKTVISPLKEVLNANLVIKLTGMNELNFSLPYYINKRHEYIKNPNISKVRFKFLIKLVYRDIEAYFIIQPPKENFDGVADLQVECLSLEEELRRRTIRSYKKTAITITEATTDILKDTNWTLGYIPVDYIDINAPRMSFDIPSKKALESLNEIAESFRLVVQFDTLLRKVNFYKEEEIGSNKGLTITERKYLQTFLRESNSEDFCTRLYVYGKNGMTINRVSLSGQSYIENYNYFLYPFQRDASRNVIEHSDYFSDSLAHAWLDYTDLLLSKQGQFDTLLDALESLESTLITKENELFVLETDKKIIEDEIEVKRKSGLDYSALTTELNSVNGLIASKQSEIASVQSQITSKNTEITNLQTTISKTSNFTTAQLDELNSYVYESEWTSEHYPDDKTLYVAGLEEFEKKSYPPFSLNVSIVNFLSMITEQRNWDKLSLGDTVRFKKTDMNIDLKAKIIQVSFDFDNDDISLEISNVTEMMDVHKRIMKKIYKSDNVAKYLDINKDNWNKTGSDMQKYIDDQIKEVNESLTNLDVDLSRSMSDGFLTKSEVNVLKINLEQLQAESTDIIAIANTLTIDSQPYSTALNDLSSFLTTYINATVFPIEITQGNRVTMTSLFETVQSTKSTLINQIGVTREENAKSYTDTQIDEVNTVTTTLQNQIDDFSNDGKLTLTEANTLASTLNQFKNESTDLVNVATGLSITTEKTDYSTAITNLENELNTNWLGKTNYPLDITTVQRNNLKTLIGNVQTKKSILINKIVSVRETNAKDYTDEQIGEVETLTTTLQNQLNDFSNDGKLTLAEANSLKSTLNQLKKEAEDVVNIATSLTITTEKTNYSTALTNMETELNKWINQPTYPKTITTTDRNNIKTVLENVQSTKSILINKITSVQSQAGKNADDQTKKTIRNSNAIAAPTILNTGTAIDHVANTDGSVDISFEWLFTEDANSPISGFGVLVYSSDSSSAHTPDIVTDLTIPQDKKSRSVILQGVAANKYYTFGVYAYRLVDTSINAEGIIRSPIVKSTLAGENPYQPSNNVSFSGDILGTIGGVPYDRYRLSSATYIIAVDGSTTNPKRADFIIPSGATNAQTTINNVINMCPTGGKIMLLDGTYVIDGNIQMKEGIELEGLGNSTIIKNKDNNMKVVWMINADGINKVKVKNLQIDGGINSGYNSIGVQLWSSQESTVEGLVIKNMDDAAVQTVDTIRCNILNTIIEGNQRAVHCTGATELNMTNNIIRNNQSGIFGRITNSSILNNVIQGNNFNAIELDWGSVNNKINDNTIIDNAGHGISLQSGFGTVAVESKSNSIQNNTISYNGLYGIVLDGRNSVAVLDTQISNNVVTGNSQTSNNLYDNIALVGKCNNNTIQGNKCRKGDRTNKSRGGLGITNAASTNNVVINNDLVDSGVTYYFTDMGTGTKTTSQNYSGVR